MKSLEQSRRSINGVDLIPEVSLGSTVDSCLSTPELGLPEDILESQGGAVELILANALLSTHYVPGTIQSACYMC